VEGEIQMNSLLQKDITLRIISVLLAVMLWFIIMNVSNPYKTRTLNISLNVVNENTLQDKGIINKSRNFPNSISIVVKAREKVLNSLSQNDFIATLDLSRVYSTSQKELPVDAPKYVGSGDKSEIQVLEVKPSTVSLDLEKYSQNLFRVDVTPVGAPKKNYKIIRVTATPESVAIQGMDSQIKAVAAVKTVIDVSNLDRDIVVKKECKVYNKDGEELPSIGKNLNVDVKVEVAKEVPLAFSVKGTPAKDFVETGRQITPEKVLITGPPEVVTKIEELKVEQASIDNITSNFEMQRKIMLPNGVKLYNSPQEAVVSVTVEQLKDREIAIDKADISFTGSAQETSLQYEVLTQDIKIILRGKQEDLDKLDLSSLRPYVEVNDIKEGTHKLPLKVLLPYGVSSPQEILVEVKVTKK